MAFNSYGQGGGINKDSGAEIWSRQPAILERITELEALYDAGELMMTSEGEQYGPYKNIRGCELMLVATEGIHRRIFPFFKEVDTVTKKRRNGEEYEHKVATRHAKDTKRYTTYVQSFNTARMHINRTKNAGPNTPIGMKNLQLAYSILKNCMDDLRVDTAKLGIDFKHKNDPTEAWKS